MNSPFVFRRLRAGGATVPNAYVLTSERFHAIQEELKRLRRQVERPAAQTPTRLVLKGKAEGSLVTLQAVFDFV